MTAPNTKFAFASAASLVEPRSAANRSDRNFGAQNENAPIAAVCAQ